MHLGVIEEAKAHTASTRPPETLLRRYLNTLWLRPENALWMTLRSLTMSRCDLRRPAVDVSCGDGVFLFLHLGGEFDPDFDVFTSVGHLDDVRTRHANVFDHVDAHYVPTVVAPPRMRVDLGTDAKPAMLEKARRLPLYDRLLEHDNNAPLPIPHHAFASVYCNAAYWIRNIDAFLADLAGITAPTGRVILHVKLTAMRAYTLDAFRGVLGDRFLDIVGRGRMDCWPTLADRKTWETRFCRAGLTIHDVTPIASRTHAHLWDVGLRPIAPLLMKMVRAINPRTRASIKREWVDLFLELLTPFCRPDLELFEGPSEPAELQYLLTPSPKA